MPYKPFSIKNLLEEQKKQDKDNTVKQLTPLNKSKEEIIKRVSVPNHPLKSWSINQVNSMKK